jgi:hypothetical protein
MRKSVGAAVRRDPIYIADLVLRDILELMNPTMSVLDVVGVVHNVACSVDLYLARNVAKAQASSATSYFYCVNGS